jgi:hypothetical protein
MTLNVVYGSGATHDRQAAVQRLVSDGFVGVIAGTLTSAVGDRALIASVEQMLDGGVEVILQVSCATEERAFEMIGELAQRAPAYIHAPTRHGAAVWTGSVTYTRIIPDNRSLTERAYEYARLTTTR